MITLPQSERTDLFLIDAVAEIVEAALAGKEPLIYRLEWDDTVQAHVVSGVEKWSEQENAA